MNNEEIEITIHPDGRVEYLIKGVKGSSCEAISDVLAQLGEVAHEERTGEYYEEGTDDHIHVS